MIRLRHTVLLITHPNLYFLGGLSTLLIAKSYLCANTQATASDLLIHNTFVPQKSFFRKFLMTSLNVICGLGPPINNPGYAYGTGGHSNWWYPDPLTIGRLLQPTELMLSSDMKHMNAIGIFDNPIALQMLALTITMIEIA